MNDSYKGNLRVGGDALIIGCSFPENSYMIGSMVTVEYIKDVGDEIPEHFKAKEGTWDYYPGERLVVVSSPVHSHPAFISNHLGIMAKFLMPMDDPDFTKELEQEENPYKVAEAA